MVQTASCPDGTEESEQLSQNGHDLSIDPGLHNLMTCYDSGNGRAFILGRKYLSLERYFHKEISRVQSIWYAQQSGRGIKHPKSSKHIQKLYRKSQCSPLSPEVSKSYAEASNRKERGMYVADGMRYNADAVGAFNILRKYVSVTGKKKELSVTGLKNPEIIKVAV